MTLVDQNELSPEELAEQCKAGCRESFEMLVEQFEKRIFNFLYHFTGNSHDAEDITQETFLKAYQNMHRYDSAYAFATWLFTIAKRTAISHFRSKKPSEELSADTEADLADPSAALEAKEERVSLWNLAKTLKSNQYETLWLRYGEGFSIAEIAQVMNTNQIHVKVLLHRARRHLAKRLRPPTNAS
ncbi:MAG: RNA polymerase sigma factor [Pedosphaera sp.]|nr:RNA polymerase sigma factor [Pedosphaera sp.]